MNLSHPGVQMIHHVVKRLMNMAKLRNFIEFVSQNLTNSFKYLSIILFCISSSIYVIFYLLIFMFYVRQKFLSIVFDIFKRSAHFLFHVSFISMQFFSRKTTIRQMKSRGISATLILLYRDICVKQIKKTNEMLSIFILIEDIFCINFPLFFSNKLHI